MWAYTLRDKQTRGWDVSSLITRWNAMSSETNQIVGGKRVAVLKILRDFPMEAFDQVIHKYSNNCLTFNHQVVGSQIPY